MINNVIVLDTETTGFPEDGASLLEIGWTSVPKTPIGGWSYGNSSSTFLRYEKEIPPQARAVHHISPEDVRQAPERDVVIGHMLQTEKPEEMCYAAHNAQFDKQFLSDLTLPWICTWRCALHLFPDAPGHSNQVLRYYLNAEPPAEVLRGGLPHRARYDTVCTAEILLKMLETHTPEQLLELSNQPVLLSTVRFGKYKGMKWADIPRDYLWWLKRQPDFGKDMDVAYTVNHYLN